MAVFFINGRDVEFTRVFAKCPEIGYTQLTEAILVHDTADEFCDGDGVIFGEAMPTTAEEAENLLYDYEPITDCETLESVVKRY